MTVGTWKQRLGLQSAFCAVRWLGSSHVTAGVGGRGDLRSPPDEQTHTRDEPALSTSAFSG